MYTALLWTTVGLALGIAGTLVVLWLRRNTAKKRRQLITSDDAERSIRANYFAHVGTWEWEIKPNKLYWSDEIYAIFGHKVGDVTPSYSLFARAVHPDDIERVQKQEKACLAGDSRHEIEYRVIWPDGSVHWVMESGDVLFDEQGQAEKFTGIARDITASKESTERLKALAHFDALTGLPNRELLRIRIVEAMEKSKLTNSKMALVFMDLNKFKPINDVYGHVVGDKVLHAIAQRLNSSIRGSDTIARVGGDEFVAILNSINTTRDITTVVEKLRNVFLQPLAIDGRRHQLAISIGVSIYPDDASDIESLMHIADMAMYQAKQSGENQYLIASDSGRGLGRMI
ncbi:hypothetical protein SIN8267_01411 [Sinobacterium norvegicum]|uniref:Diguanylate cyclase n=1 Tax=Sinobacterium norvegicum TaxID=1641715 RepID=A0ABN8EFV7_9GAMM|nr:sensor domain-containing diguanylate cyclase [Sinobacterium norvegicum]CAH0991308.1 hypothetical protein SIN8267_01411 [Sinobacterium norvegicum]